MTTASIYRSQTIKGGTTVLIGISFCHLLNDMMQSLLPSVYPGLKEELSLSFSQVGLVTLAYQVTACLLQPLVGLYTDRRPLPMALPLGTLLSLVGLAMLAFVSSYPLLLVGAMLLGIGSAFFHPELSRIAKTAGGGRDGWAQSFFQVGGNIGQAVGPLAAAIFFAHWGRSSLGLFSLLALISFALLWNISAWYKGQTSAPSFPNTNQHLRDNPVVKGAWKGVAILLALIFSKFIYLTSLTNYFTFYLLHRFGVSVENAQMHLFIFVAAVAAGTMIGGPLGDRFGRKFVIWFSILGPLPFTLMLPHANLQLTMPLTVVIGLILASAFPAIVVYAQELIPGQVGMVSGLFFGFSFGMGGVGAALLGWIADHNGIEAVYQICAFLPLIGVLCFALPKTPSKA